jgi:hypothetical protein
LPADFETFGQAVATSMADLLGGTTGQVLSKASNTDMDFTWVTSDDANAIQNAIVDAKGDLIAASAADTPARLAVGNNGETLVADSSTSTGLRYTAGTVQANPILNSAFQVWQRGTTSATTDRIYTADRWQKGSGTNYTHSRQTTSDTTNLPFIQYSLRAQRTASSSSTTAVELGQSMETINCIPFAGKTVTMSFYARAGANFSSTSNLLLSQVYSGTSTDGNLFSGTFTGAATPVSSNVTLTTTWQRFTITGTIATTATQLCPYFVYTPTGTAGANDWFEITGVQLDIGSVALPFRTYAGTIQGELAACQRYYWRQTGPNAYSAFSNAGAAASTVQAVGIFQNPSPMRTVPTSIDFANIEFRTVASAGYAVSGFTLDGGSSSNILSYAYGTISSGPAANTFGRICGSNNAAAYVGFSAEL